MVERRAAAERTDESGVPVLEAVNLCKSFGGFALRDVCFRVPRGSIVGLIGRNGAGKSTLLKTCMGVLQRGSGSIRFQGTEVGRAGLAREAVGFVAEHHPFYDSMRAGEFLRFCASFYPSWDWSYCTRLQQRFQLAPDCKVRDLSHGTRTKLALISMLAFRPQLLLLDEPTTGLDPAVRREFLLELQTCVVEDGGLQAVILSSHFLEDIETIADELFVMRDGVLSTYGSISELPKAWSLVHVEGSMAQARDLTDGLAASLSMNPSRSSSLILVERRETDRLLDRCTKADVRVSEVREPTLQEAFLGMV